MSLWQYQQRTEPVLSPGPEVTQLDKWFVQASEPVRLRKRLLGLEDAHGWWEEIATPPAETITLDKWYQPASEPLQFKHQTRPGWYTDPVLSPGPEVAQLDKWFMRASEPVRRVRRLSDYTERTPEWWQGVFDDDTTALFQWRALYPDLLWRKQRVAESWRTGEEIEHFLRDQYQWTPTYPDRLPRTHLVREGGERQRILIEVVVPVPEGSWTPIFPDRVYGKPWTVRQWLANDLVEFSVPEAPTEVLFRFRTAKWYRMVNMRQL